MITVQPAITTKDRERLLRLLAALHDDDVGMCVPQRTEWASTAVTIVHMGGPIPKARARVTRHGSYTPTRTVIAQRNLTTTLAEAVRERPWYSNVAIAMVFFLPDRRRVDKDNLEKLVMDAGTKAELWQDDCQVTRGITLVELDPIQPRTLIGLCPTTSTLDRTIPVKDRRRPALPLQQVHIASLEPAGE